MGRTRRWLGLGLSAGLALSGCATQGAPRADAGRDQARGFCGLQTDSRAWQRLKAPPVEAETYRRLADSQPTLPQPNGFPLKERWYGAPGAIMLCRSEGPPRGACLGEWWEFGKDEADRPVVKESDAWVCFT